MSNEGKTETEGRRQEAKSRKQKAEGRRQKAGGRKQKREGYGRRQLIENLDYTLEVTYKSAAICE